MTNKLAIIIPAYKIAYLDDCLESIAQQSSKEFKLYIGNDYSPDDIDSIVDKYRDRIDLEYKIFDNNLGSSSLVKHWERCINMMGDEEWIWLFSDDDMMDENAVECFYNQKRSVNNVYRFNLNIVDKDNNRLDEVIYANSETAVSFLGNRLQYKYESAITNYIFNRQAYNNNNGFVDFPLGWSCDDAAIIQFTGKGNIILITDCKISWRKSGINISTSFDKKTGVLKTQARVQFIEWLFKEKINVLKELKNYKTIISVWYLHALKVELSGESLFQKFSYCNKISPFVGLEIYKEFFRYLKSQSWSRIYTFLKEPKE